MQVSSRKISGSQQVLGVYILMLIGYNLGVCTQVNQMSIIVDYFHNYVVVCYSGKEVEVVILMK